MILRADDIHLYFNRTPILRGVSMALATGELVGLIGPNGAGKTSLLRVLARLQEADTGLLQLNGQPYSRVNRVQFAAAVGYLEQGAPVHWPLRVRRLVELGRLPHRPPWSPLSAQDSAIVEAAMQQAEVTHLADRVVTTLSGGERLRVLIARLFATEPTIILADEPIAALDPYHQMHTMELLRDHCQRGGSGVVVMHDLNTAARFCDRLVLLNCGEIVCQGTPPNVLTPELLRSVYGIDVRVQHLAENELMVVPTARASTP